MTKATEKSWSLTNNSKFSAIFHGVASMRHPNLAENASFLIFTSFSLALKGQSSFLRFFKCSEFRIEVASILFFLTLYYIYFELRLVRLELFYLSKSKCNELWPKSVKLLNYTELSLLSSVGIIFKITLERARFCSE